MKDLVLLFSTFIALVVFNTLLLAQNAFKHKSENEIKAMSPAQRVEEVIKERLYHGVEISDDNYEPLLRYIHKNAIETLPALESVAARYEPRPEQTGPDIRFETAFLLAREIDDSVIRIRTTDKGRSLIKSFENVLGRMQNAGYAEDTHKWYRRYLGYEKDVAGLQGKQLSLIDGYIQESLEKKHTTQISDEEMLKFSNYLTSYKPTYPSNCKVKSLACINSKWYYETYLKFKRNGREFN
jgi:hypothetical protein